MSNNTGNAGRPAYDAIDEFRAAMMDAGLNPPKSITPGEKIRFPSKDKKDTDDAAWCKLFNDMEGGIYGDYSTGLYGVWQLNREGKKYTQAEKAAFRKKCEAEKKVRDDERKAGFDRASAKAMAILNASKLDPAQHPYAIRKRLDLGPLIRRGEWPQRAKATRNKPAWPGYADCLLVPMYGEDGRIWTIEAINGEGEKDFLAGGDPSGKFHPFGKFRGAAHVGIGEGISTVKAVADSKDIPCVAAMTSGQLLAVARIVRKLAAPGAVITILADDDQKPYPSEPTADDLPACDIRNPGMSFAIAAAQAVGGFVAVPNIGRKADMWDLWAEKGADAVNAAIDKAIGVESKLSEQDRSTGIPVDPPSNVIAMPGIDYQDYMDDDEEGRPVIKVIGGQLPETITAAETALISHGVEIYQRQGELVRPYKLSNLIEGKGSIIPIGSVVLGGVDNNWLGKEMTRTAVYKKFSKVEKEWVTIDCPSKVSETYLSMVGEWKVKHIVGISECPTIRRDGTIITEHGYDELSGIYVDYQGKPVEVLEKPTFNHAKAAIKYLKTPLSEFPFTEPEDLSVVLSAILTAVSRRSIYTAPLHAFDAPKAGSGKSLLADVVALIATGRTAAMISQGWDEAEDEKRLGAMLMRSAPVVCIDNVERPIKGDFICTMLASINKTTRVLGESRNVDLPTNSTFLATGNNLVFQGDMTRRALLCRIDPKCERPDALSFKLNLREWIPDNRHLLISAALTILRAYHVAGKPKQPISPYGSFEDWSDLVRSALVWLGEPDPNITRERIDRADPVSAELSAVITLWHQSFRSDSRSVAEVVSECVLSVHADLKSAVLEVAASSRNPEVIEPKRLGKWLKKYENRVESGLKIEKSGINPDTKVILWRVVKA
jgi:putative DNA primase/helicase